MKPEQQKALREPFPNSAIGKLPKGGAMLDYVGHAAVTDRLLAVDPEWTWEPVAFDEGGLPRYDVKGGLWIRLTIGGTTRLGYGDGPDPKQRIGDAIRNAAMRFGVALDLWAKEDITVTTHAPDFPSDDTAPPTRTATTRDEPDPWTVTGQDRVRARSSQNTPDAEPTPAAFKALQATLGDYAKAQGLDRPAVLTVVAGLVERDIASTRDLTAAECSLVLTKLKAAS